MVNFHAIEHSDFRRILSSGLSTALAGGEGPKAYQGENRAPAFVIRSDKKLYKAVDSRLRWIED
jgi:hypothetical protein